MTASGAIDPGGTDGSGDADLRREGERIAQLIDDLGAMGGAPVRQRVEELVSRLVHLYGQGLASLLGIFGVGGELPRPLDAAQRERLRADALLSSLLVLHGLHPDQEVAHQFDPGPEAATRPTATRADGLVQIDLGRSRTAKTGPGP